MSNENKTYKNILLSATLFLPFSGRRYLNNLDSLQMSHL